MDGTISTNKIKITKIFYGVSIPLTVLVLVICLYKRITINFANIDVSLRSNGIEYLPVYSALAISISILLICLICCCIFKSNSKKSTIIKGFAITVVFIGIITSYFVSSNIVDTVTYISENSTSELSQFFPIDKYNYDESNGDFYSYKEVTFNDVYWIGSSSYKYFEPKDIVEDWTNETSDSNVFLNYYYLNDDTGKKIAEYNKKRLFYNNFYSLDNYEEKYKIDNYDVYEYEDNYELIYTNKTEALYLSASKNKRTLYDCNDLINIAEELKTNLQNQASISK